MCGTCRQYLPRAWAPKTAASTQTDSGDLEAAQLLLENLQIESSQQQQATEKGREGHPEQETPPAASGTARQYSTNPFAVSLHRPV